MNCLYLQSCRARTKEWGCERMTENHISLDYLTEGLTLAAEGGDIRSEMHGDIDQQLDLFSKAVELQLPLPERAITHAFLMRCHAYQENLEKALKELSIAREMLGKLIGFEGKELDNFVQSTWDQPLAEKLIPSFVEDMARHKPWYRILYDTDDGLLDVYMSTIDTLEDTNELTRQKVKLHTMKLFPDPDDLGFFLGYRYFELGQIDKAVLKFQKTINEANSEEWRKNKYDSRMPYEPQFGISFRTILGQIYKEKGDLRQAVKEWQTVLQVDESWLKACDENNAFYTPIIQFWIDKARELLRTSEM
jgi:tetratricopeptide (TPR) repeat protein